MKKSIGTKTFLHEHIRYEIDMLFYSYLKLIDYLKIKDQLNINAFLEVFSFHARNLYDFFIGIIKNIQQIHVRMIFLMKKVTG